MDFVTRVHSRYTYLPLEEVASIVEKAKMFYYQYSYPCDETADETTKPIKGFRAEQWILAACDEIIERLGFSSALGYRENGVTWTFDGAELSDSLRNMITPVATIVGG